MILSIARSDFLNVRVRVRHPCFFSLYASYRKELAVVTEEYTTQCCGRCGVLNKNLGKAKCGLKCGRDENAARNIFLKYLIE